MYIFQLKLLTIQRGVYILNFVILPQLFLLAFLSPLPQEFFHEHTQKMHWLFGHNCHFSLNRL